MNLSILVPVHRNADELLALLVHLADPISRGAQVIVVDDGSPNVDQIRSLCRDRADFFGIARERSYQKCRAMNAGLQAVRSDVILQLDQDKYPVGVRYWDTVERLTLQNGWAMCGPILNHYPEERRRKLLAFQ